MLWIITANSNLCRIYHLEKHPEKITLLKEINHPENKLKKSEYLTSDRPGHYQTDATLHGSYAPHTDPKEVEADNFSREIANELNQGRNNHAYQNLIIVMPPHMNGLLAKHIDKHVKDLIKDEILKDVMSLPNHELLGFIHKSMQPK